MDKCNEKKKFGRTGYWAEETSRGVISNARAYTLPPPPFKLTLNYPHVIITVGDIVISIRSVVYKCCPTYKCYATWWVRYFHLIGMCTCTYKNIPIGTLKLSIPIVQEVLRFCSILGCVRNFNCIILCNHRVP